MLLLALTYPLRYTWQSLRRGPSWTRPSPRYIASGLYLRLETLRLVIPLGQASLDDQVYLCPPIPFV